MPLAFDDLRILQLAETIADTMWKAVTSWDPFPRDAMGKQLVQAADSIGANIAEAFGRYHFGEKLTFFYARGSLFETKYWLNRAVARNLVDDMLLRGSVGQLAELARQLNSLIASTKQQRSAPPAPKAVREPTEAYDLPDRWPDELFSDQDLAWLSDPLPITSYQLPQGVPPL